jgi:transcriptional regulator with XRE-family HTH domain
MYPNLKLQIFRRGIHQNQLARAVSVDETVLSKIIRGYRKPSAAQKKILADYLQVNENWLFERYDGNESSSTPPRSEAQSEPGDAGH